MNLFTSRRLIVPALFLATGLLVVSADNSVLGQPKKEKERFKEKDKGKGKGKGVEKAAKDLRRAFDAITDFSQSPVAGKESTRVFDHAKRFYREAVKAYADDPRWAAELAAAAHDATRGLEHVRRASARPVPGLPEPPAETGPFAGRKGKGPPPPIAGADAERGPWSKALAELTAARERLNFAEGNVGATGASRDLLDAAKGVYARARTAYEAEEYRKAAELARAAEAWSHVPEHLSVAGLDGPAGPSLAPLPKAKGSGAPPPPPAIRGK